MHTAPAAVHHSRSEKSNRSHHETWQTIRMFLNKTTFELGVLGAICGAAATLVIHHPYFQITDVRIEGLDTYAGEIARQSISEVQFSRVMGVPTNNYVLLQVAHIQKLLQARVVLDSVDLTKRFPHTLVVHAAEREVAFVVVAPNGTAYIADDGSVVRWYTKDDSARADQANHVVISVSQDIQTHGLRESILDQSVVQKMNAISSVASTLHRGALSYITLALESQTVSLQFATDVSVTLRLDADIDVQMQKAKLSSTKFPTAKKIDVRFADKVFVTF